MSLRMMVWAAGCVLCPLVTTGVAAADPHSDIATAMRNREVATVRALVRQRADVNVTERDGATALHWAAYWGDLDMAQLLLRSGARVDAANAFGVTPLALAVEYGSAAMVDHLIAAGANVNAALPSGETPLMTAARVGNLSVVQTLIAHHADVNACEGVRGQTAVMWAIAERQEPILR